MLGCSVQRWSVSLGRWAGIQVRLHIFFFVFAALAIAFSTLPDMDILGDGLLTLAVVLVQRRAPRNCPCAGRDSRRRKSRRDCHWAGGRTRFAARPG